MPNRLPIALALSASLPGLCLAQDVSAPVILQYFESRYSTIEQRMPDVFAAGYGSIYTPPPGRAESGNSSVGYDQYDRFDLGQPGNPTLYGTETGLRTLTSLTHRAGMDYYIDLVWNHDGFSDAGNANFMASGGYPGMALTLQTSNPNAPGYNLQGYNAIDGDFHSAFASGDQDGRISGLVDIDHFTNFQLIRNPVTPGDPRNIPAGTTPQFGRLANVPTPTNARFYPDANLQPIYLFDPKTGEQNIPVYPFNTANPMAGDAVPENVLGYLMRNAQWLVQSVGVDGFRLDAAKHYPGQVLDYFDRAVYRSNPRLLLNGQQKQVFSFSEVFDSNQDYLQTFIQKNINPNDPGRIGANRDTLDFPLFFALHDNLTSNGLNNNWFNIKSASLDMHDDGLHNGSQGVTFVSSHDSFGPDLSSVAYAYTLMLPGNSIVYFNAHEFGANRDFPKDGRGDALGGQYGDAITTLVDLRNRFGRGNYIQRWIEKENLAYERQGSALVLLSNRTDAGFDSRTIQTSFAPGTHLIELTGNAADPAADPFNDIPQVLTVNGDGTVNARFLRNTAPGTSNFTGKGYLIYGLPTPQGSLSLTNISKTLPGSTTGDNATTRVNDVQVITANSFQVKLNTVAVNLLGNSSLRDHDADGDNAVLSLDGGIDLNNNGHVDYTTPGSVVYGFEEFTTTHQPGYFQANGNGLYAQTIDASRLSEGMHFLTVRAFRHRSDGGPAVFTDFRQSIYVDRLPPNSAIASFAPLNPSNTTNRQLIVQSLDQTANSVHVFLNLPAGVSNAQILSMVGDNTHAGQIDRDLFAYGFNSVPSGNNVVTVVSYEMTGNYNIQRFPGLSAATSKGAGLGDLDFNNAYTPNDITLFDTVLYSNNTQFNPAADLNADGLVTPADLMLLGPRLAAVHADAATTYQFNNLLVNPPAGVEHNYTATLDNSAGASLAKFGPGTLTLNGPQIHGPGASLTLNAGQTNLNTDAGSNLSITVNASATLTLGSTQHLASLTLNDAHAALTPGHDKLIVIHALSLTPNSTLDLSDNDLVLYYTGPSPENQLQQWANHNLIASLAASPSFSQFARTLAVFDNHDAHFLTFDGQSFPDFNQVIVKYTYLGDANADGRVDPTDYAVVDGKLGIGHSWITGDLNFDGKVDPSDYAQIDGNQGAGLGGLGGPQLALALPLPEPTALFPILLASLISLAHRRRSSSSPPS